MHFKSIGGGGWPMLPHPCSYACVRVLNFKIRVNLKCFTKYINNNNTFISRGWHIWHECQSNLWSSKTYMRSIITDRTKIIYNMYRADEVSVHRACCERTTQPYFLGGGGTIYPVSRPAHVTACSPRMVAECFLTRSMLIKIYYHFMICACICTIVFTVSQFHAT